MTEVHKIKNEYFGISILRILATFSVIMIHVSGPIVVDYGNVSNFDWNIANFYDAISRYSVPIFFMISGALLLNKDYRLMEFLKGKLIKIVLPFIIWSLFYSIINRYVLNEETFDIIKIIKDVFYGSEYHLWFIYALIGVYLTVPIIRQWIKRASQKEILYFIIIWIITLVIGIPGLDVYFPKIDFVYFSGFIGYFVLGYYLSKFKSIGKCTAVLFIFLGLIITIYGTYFYTIKTSKFFGYFYEYLNLNTLLVSSGLFIILHKKKIFNKKMKSSISILSKCSFGIYLIHPLILRLFRLNSFDVYMFSPIISIVIISLSCFIISYVIIFCIKKIKFGHLIT